MAFARVLGRLLCVTLPPKTFLRSVFGVGVLEGPDAATR
jgi:hypothetical protein